jgi:hypothetical protein
MKSKAKQPVSPESEREKRVQASLVQARETLARMDKKYGKPEPLSEEERDWRWHHLMRHKRFLDED